MSAHTPGPWEAFGSAVHATNGREILFGAHNTRSGTAEEQRANARLIAAAPELLAALRALEAKCDEGNYVRQNDDARVAARALLARVDGGGQ